MKDNIKRWYSVEEAKNLDLKKIYKYVLVCKYCHNQFGSDSRKVIKICPVCSPRLLRNKNRYKINNSQYMKGGQE